MVGFVQRNRCLWNLTWHKMSQRNTKSFKFSIHYENTRNNDFAQLYYCPLVVTLPILPEQPYGWSYYLGVCKEDQFLIPCMKYNYCSVAPGHIVKCIKI